MDAHQAKIFTAILISSFTLGTVIVYFVISILRQQSKNLKLQRLNILTEINAIEKERTRLAQDLHDELGPLLTVIKFEINSVEAKSDDDQLLLKRVSSQLDDSISKMREVARNMMPTVLLRKGLKTALEEMINQTNEYSPLLVQFHYRIEINIDQERSINIYRIIMEIIQNAIKHSGASELIIQIENREGRLEIITEDNGVGFDYEAIREHDSGLGLRNLKSRVELMGGKFIVHSKISKGTQFIFDVPLN